MNIDDALHAMAKHAAENPTHGYNCACKDEFTVQAKSYLRGNPELYSELLLLTSYVSRDNYLRVDVDEKLNARKRAAAGSNRSR